MSLLPSGTVTFLFTDVEGSTRAWERDPEAMRVALARHDAALRGAIEGRGGRVFKTVGDAFCAAFARSSDALAAAVAGQLALGGDDWGAAGPPRVRMALHAGAAESRDGDYVSPVLNRLSRLLSAAHGGQVLVTEAVRELARDALPEGVALRDLGAHRLRDLQQPVHVYQVVHPRLRAEFPPLATLEALRGNLPKPLTTFVGREREAAEVARMLATSRLVTLTGAGGTGKTRLALQVAADLAADRPHGVWLVDLAALNDPALVPQAVASALGVKEEGATPLMETLEAYLESRRPLLVLDNCEHLLEACASLVSRLLATCPGVTLLATSRSALGVRGETSLVVPPLSTPDPRQLPAGADAVAAVERFEAVRLFVERAAAARPGFMLTPRNAAAVAQICHRLDGIPLALELAAGRARVLSPEDIASRLDDRFRLLKGGGRDVLPRHQTLRATIDWSHDLLSGTERALLRRLAVFAGGWPLEAAEAVCAGDGVGDDKVLELQASLMDKSLVAVEENAEGETRSRLLGTIRQYAWERLVESGEETLVRGRHREWFLTFAEQAAGELQGADQALWLDRLEADHDDLRAALDWSVREAGGGEAALRLAGALRPFWAARGHLAEGRRWLEAALRVEPAAGGKPRARALQAAAILAWAQGDFERAAELLEESRGLLRALGDPRELARALILSGIVAQARGLEEASAAPLEEGLALAREAGARDLIVMVLNNRGETARLRGDHEHARALYEKALSEEMHERGRSVLLGNLGRVALAQGDLAAARDYFAAGMQLSRRLRDQMAIANALEGLAGVSAAQGRALGAARLLGAADALRKQIQLPVETTDRAEHEQFVAAARAGLSAGDFDRAWAEGGELELERAIEEALAEEAPPAGGRPSLAEGDARNGGKHVAARDAT